MGPYLAKCGEASGRLLRRFKREFRCPTEGCRQLRNTGQLRLVALDHASICFAEEDCFIPSGTVAKIGLKPINQA